MEKTKEELNAIKEEVEAVDEKLAELTPEEIAQVNGGQNRRWDDPAIAYPFPSHGPKIE